jgi:hypothetical protein
MFVITRKNKKQKQSTFYVHLNREAMKKGSYNPLYWEDEEEEESPPRTAANHPHRCCPPTEMVTTAGLPAMARETEGIAGSGGPWKKSGKWDI